MAFFQFWGFSEPGSSNIWRLLACNAPVAQLDRASVYGTEGREFESLRARYERRLAICGAFAFYDGHVMVSRVSSGLR
jgi:hypothetical protein